MVLSLTTSAASAARSSMRSCRGWSITAGVASASSGAASGSGSCSSGGGSVTAVRTFSSSSQRSAKPRRERSADDPLALDKMGKYTTEDYNTYGHMLLDRNRELLHYARLVEWELPKLTKLRKSYVAPSPSESFVRLRAVHYQGEAHPVTRKCVLTVNVADVFASEKLASPAARRKFLLLAGVRWNPLERIANQTSLNDDKDEERRTKETFDVFGDHAENERIALSKGIGMIKISCERFPYERMNMKWCSDVLDDLIAEANQNPETMEDVPLDLRHVKARELSRKNFARHNAPSLKSSFPAQWLKSATPTTRS